MSQLTKEQCDHYRNSLDPNHPAQLMLDTIQALRTENSALRTHLRWALGHILISGMNIIGTPSCMVCGRIGNRSVDSIEHTPKCPWDAAQKAAGHE